MLDLSYERDTEIVDVDEPSQPIARPRVPTKDLIVHVRDENGQWHRLHPNRLQTACGRPWTNWGHENTRSGRYPEHPLAECDCWTKAERAEADELARGWSGQTP